MNSFSWMSPSSKTPVWFVVTVLP